MTLMVSQPVKKACAVALQLIRALPAEGKNDPSQFRPTGTLLFVRAECLEYLHSFALVLASELSQPTPLPVYRVQGGISEDDAPLLGLAKRTAIGSLGPEVIYSGIEGLTLPQDRPIILLVEDFTAVKDQRTFAHMVDGGGQHISLYNGSVLIAGLRKGEIQTPESGTVDR